MKAFLIHLLLAASVIAGAALPAAASQWLDGATMMTARAEAGAAAIGTDIYVAGGAGITGAKDVFELYDTIGDNWYPLPAMPLALMQFGMAASGGRIYVSGGFGGETGAEAPQSALWVFDTETQSWLAKSPMPAARFGHAMAALGGKLYVIGGTGGSATFIYDTGTDSWATGAALPTARAGLAAAVAGGKIYAIGGRAGSASSGAVEVYDPAADRWRKAASLPRARAGLTAAALGARIHVTGGESLNPSRTFADHFVLDTGSGRWSRGPAMPTARHSLTSAAVEGRWYVIGGGAGAGVFTVFTDIGAVQIFVPD